MESKKIIKEVIIIFWLFVLGSILGYIFETLVVLIREGRFAIRQGLLYGPFIPVYGIGIVIYYLFLHNVPIKNKVATFFATMILGGITEYFCSYVQEKIFGTVSWDYSYLKFHINGRTSLLHCTYWGIAGVLYSVYIVPFIESLREKVDKMSFKIITLLTFLLLFLDIDISWVASYRQMERKNEIPAENSFETFLDQHYPDEYIDRIYNNKIERY